MPHTQRIGCSSACYGPQRVVDCRVCRLWRSALKTKQSFLGSNFNCSGSTTGSRLITFAESVNGASPNGRRRDLRHPPSPRPKLRQTHQGASSGADATASAGPASAGPRTQYSRPGTSATTQEAAFLPSLLSPESSETTSFDLLYRNIAPADIDQLNSLVPAFSLDDIFAGKPLPVELSTGTRDGAEGNASTTGRDKEDGATNSSLDLTTQFASERQNLSGLRRRSSRPWERPAAPAAEPPAPLPANTQQPELQPGEPPPARQLDEPQGTAPSSSQFESSTIQTFEQLDRISEAAGEKDCLGTPPPASPAAAAADLPAVVYDEDAAAPASSSSSESACSAATRSTWLPSSLPARGDAGPRLQEGSLPGRSVIRTVHPVVVPCTKPAAPGHTEIEKEGTSSDAPAALDSSTTAEAGAEAAASLPDFMHGSALLLPRPVRAQPIRSPSAPIHRVEPPAMATEEALTALASLSAPRSTAPPSASASNSLDFGPAAPLATTPMTTAAAEPQPATNSVVRSTRLPRAVRVRSKEWLEAAQAVEAASRGDLASSIRIPWEPQPASVSVSSGPGAQGVLPAAPRTRHQAAEPQQPWRSVATSSGRGKTDYFTPSQVQPEAVSEPRGVLVLHEAPLRDALEAATSAAFPLPSREQLPETVDRRSWHLHAAVLFPDLYDADWHSCLFDFLFELWPEVGRAHVTTSGTAGRRRLLLSSEVEITEALEAEAEGTSMRAVVTPPSSSVRVQRATKVLEDAYTFVTRCFDSMDFAVRSAVVISVLDCLGDHDELMEHLAVKLPPLMVQRLLVPLVPRFQPAWVVEEWLSAVADAYPSYVPVATVPRRWRELVERLEAAEVVHPGGGLGVVHTVLEFEEEAPQEQQSLKAHPGGSPQEVTEPQEEAPLPSGRRRRMPSRPSGVTRVPGDYSAIRRAGGDGSGDGNTVDKMSDGGVTAAIELPDSMRSGAPSGEDGAGRQRGSGARGKGRLKGTPQSSCAAAPDEDKVPQKRRYGRRKVVAAAHNRPQSSVLN